MWPWVPLHVHQSVQVGTGYLVVNKRIWSVPHHGPGGLVLGVWSGGFGGAGAGRPVPVPVPSLGSFLQLPAACRVLAGSFMAKSVLLQLDGGRTTRAGTSNRPAPWRYVPTDTTDVSVRFQLTHGLDPGSNPPWLPWFTGMQAQTLATT